MSVTASELQLTRHSRTAMVQRKRKHKYMIMYPKGTEYERRGQNIPKYESMKQCAMVELGFTPGF